MGVLDDTGRFMWSMVGGAGYTLDLLCRTCVQSVSIPRKLRPLIDQMYVTGVKTIPVTTLVAVFAGMILSLQTGIELRKFSQHTMIGNIVAISMCREMGPFITGLILAATVGSTMAAELGTMKVSEEIAALEVMSIDPVKFLVLPRVAALSLMCPVLTLFSDFIGIIGGAFVADTQLGVSFPLYWNNVRDSLSSSTSYFPKDVYTGLFKAWVFGITISVIGCSSGLRAEGGALGVGRAVQLAVMYSMLLIIILGYIITWFFYVLI